MPHAAQSAVGLWQLLEELIATPNTRVAVHLRSGRDIVGVVVNARVTSDDLRTVLVSAESPMRGACFLAFTEIEAITILDLPAGDVVTPEPPKPAAPPPPPPLVNERTVTQMQKDLRQRVHPGIFCELDFGGRPITPDERRMVQRLVEDVTAVLTAMAESDELKALLERTVRIIRLTPGDTSNVQRERDVLVFTTAQRETDALTRGELRRRIHELIEG